MWFREIADFGSETRTSAAKIVQGASDRDLVRWAEGRLHGLSGTGTPQPESAGPPKAAPAGARVRTGAGS